MVTNTELDKKTDELFDRTHIYWDKSKEDMWSQMEELISDVEDKKVVRLNTQWVRYAVAAAIIALLAIPVSMRLYTRTIECQPGEHLAYQLPDGSVVHLNANSSLAYHPAWWRFSRKLEFKGEGFFEVEKGSAFTVESHKGATEVLGTSFNVFARDDMYSVTCVTGKVKVMAAETNNQVLLLPNENANLNQNGKLEVKKGVETGQVIGWVQKRFVFTATPLNSVFEEISRQYGIPISLEEENSSTYTGYFTLDYSVEETLELICKPFNLEFVRNTENGYTILAQ